MFNGIQSASTNTVLRSSTTMNYLFHYEANKESQDDQSTKQNNQFLSVVDLYSLDPSNLKVTISSSNYGVGNYPDLAKHRWLIRTHDGFFLKINFEHVQVEADLDIIDVYKFHASSDKELVDQVTVAKQLVVKCNQALIVFRSDCSVNRSGFQATALIIKNNEEAMKKGKIIVIKKTLNLKIIKFLTSFNQTWKNNTRL